MQKPSTNNVLGSETLFTSLLIVGPISLLTAIPCTIVCCVSPSSDPTTLTAAVLGWLIFFACLILFIAMVVYDRSPKYPRKKQSNSASLWASPTHDTLYQYYVDFKVAEASSSSRMKITESKPTEESVSKPFMSKAQPILEDERPMDFYDAGRISRLMFAKNVSRERIVERTQLDPFNTHLLRKEVNAIIDFLEKEPIHDASAPANEEISNPEEISKPIENEQRTVAKPPVKKAKAKPSGSQNKKKPQKTDNHSSPKKTDNHSSPKKANNHSSPKKPDVSTPATQARKLLNEHHIKLSGVTFEGRQNNIAVTSVGTPVRVVASLNNPYDPYAVEIFNDWRTLGFIPKGQNRSIHDAILRQKHVFEGRVEKILGGGYSYSYGLIVHLYEYDR